jgi:hypothetical protein
VLALFHLPDASSDVKTRVLVAQEVRWRATEVAQLRDAIAWCSFGEAGQQQHLRKTEQFRS